MAYCAAVGLKHGPLNRSEVLDGVTVNGAKGNQLAIEH